MNDIKDLIEKYYAGSTSLEEEKMLRDYFRGAIHPASDPNEGEEGVDRMVISALGDCPDFGAMAEKACGEEAETAGQKPSVWVRARRWYAAASVALLVGIGATAMWLNTPPPVQSEPEMTVAEATEHTRRALTLFANAVNRSRQSVRHADSMLSGDISEDNETSY